MRPYRCSTISRPTAWPSQNAEERLRLRVSCQSPSARSSTVLRTLRPTACRKTCGVPPRPTASRTAARQASAVRRSATSGLTSPPASFAARTTVSRFSAFTSTSATRAPCSARLSALAPPSPPAPKTSAGRRSSVSQSCMGLSFASEFSYYESSFLDTVADLSSGCPGPVMHPATRRLRDGSHHQGRKAIYAPPHRQLLVHGAPSPLRGGAGAFGTPGVPCRGPG